jgi:hypothetical protein
MGSSVANASCQSAIIEAYVVGDVMLFRKALRLWIRVMDQRMQIANVAMSMADFTLSVSLSRYLARAESPGFV